MYMYMWNTSVTGRNTCLQFSKLEETKKKKKKVN